MLRSDRFLRFSISYRIQHWVLLISFAALAITGLIQVNVDLGPAVWIIGALGGIEVVRLLHHLAAIALMIGTIYHLSHLLYQIFVLRVPMSMLPVVADLRNAVQTLRYNLGFSKTPPYQGFYTFEEKLEYWAVIWGTIVMGITGFMLWNPIATTRILPGSFVPAAKMAHRLEAILAVLAILLWHLYHVHLKHFNKSIFTGYMSEEEMLDEHPQTLDELRAGVEAPSIHPEVLARRRQIFGFMCGPLVVVMLAGVWFFVGYEHTAITTVPPAEEVTVFVHLTPTPLPTIAPSPAGSEGVEGGAFQHPWPLEGAHASADCADCHVEGQELTSDCSGCHQPPSDHYGTNCADCHTPTSFKDARLPAEAHPIELIGAHASASCEGCHGGGEETPEYVCSNCHARPENHLPGECGICHTPRGFVESASFLVDLAPAIPHEVEGRDDCFMCHDPKGEIEPAPSNHGEYENEQCTLCHKTEQ